MHLAIRFLLGACLVLAFAVNASNADEYEGELEVITLLSDGSKPLPDFRFVDHRREILAKDRLQGQWNLMFFGYTHCPDVCPTTLLDIGRTYKAIEDEAIRKSLGVFFVSVDPERDHPEHLAQYIGYFNSAFTAASAPDDELKKLTAALGVTYKINRKTASQTDYLVSHSGFVVLIDPDARFAGLYFPTPEQAEAAARDLTRLVSSHPS